MFGTARAASVASCTPSSGSGGVVTSRRPAPRTVRRRVHSNSTPRRRRSPRPTCRRLRARSRTLTWRGVNEPRQMECHGAVWRGHARASQPNDPGRAETDPVSVARSLSGLPNDGLRLARRPFYSGMALRESAVLLAGYFLPARALPFDPCRACDRSMPKFVST